MLTACSSCGAQLVSRLLRCGRLLILHTFSSGGLSVYLNEASVLHWQLSAYKQPVLTWLRECTCSDWKCVTSLLPPHACVCGCRLLSRLCTYKCAYEGPTRWPPGMSHDQRLVWILIVRCIPGKWCWSDQMRHHLDELIWLGKASLYSADFMRCSITSTACQAAAQFRAPD